MFTCGPALCPPPPTHSWFAVYVYINVIRLVIIALLFMFSFPVVIKAQGNVLAHGRQAADWFPVQMVKISSPWRERGGYSSLWQKKGISCVWYVVLNFSPLSLLNWGECYWLLAGNSERERESWSVVLLTTSFDGEMDAELEWIDTGGGCMLCGVWINPVVGEKRGRSAASPLQGCFCLDWWQ